MKTTALLLAALVPSMMVAGCQHGPAKTLTLDLGNNVTMKLVLIPVGKFMMGSPPDQDPMKVTHDGFEEPQHEVRISQPFYMGACEVTRGQFAAFVKDTDHKTDDEDFDRLRTWRKPGFEQIDDHPVVCISHDDATAFCQWLSRNTGRTVRLPTEAEWEYACRAGTTTAFHWGDNPDSGKGWCNGTGRTGRAFPFFDWEDGFVYTAPVASFKPNAWGLYDMHGNAAEWCAGGMRGYDPAPKIDPKGPTATPEGHAAGRVIRGGSWSMGPWSTRCSYRYIWSPDRGECYVGFRVVVIAAAGTGDSRA